MTLDHKYLPTAIVLPFEGNSRQSSLMHAQVEYSEEKYRELWFEVIKAKISNQSRCLALLGLHGSEKIAEYVNEMDELTVDYTEAISAKDYFGYYHPGLNRRDDDPVNSRLNYGYSIVRSAIARNLVVSGFHLAFGMHHDNQLNLFNLADDLIEPYRAMVDQVAYHNMGANEKLSKKERKNMSEVLFSACEINGQRVNVITAIGLMCDSLKRIIMECSEESFALPMILPFEILGDITE